MVITLLQVISIRKTSEATKIAIKEYSNRAEQLIFVSSISKYIRIIREVKTHINHDEYPEALLRLNDIKDFISSFDISQIILVNRSRILTTLAVDIGNLEDVLYRGKSGVSMRDISQNLEELIEALFNVENTIKTIEL